MSKGQKAKAEVAAGMAKRTKYIIMDEPFIGKDLEKKLFFFNVSKELGYTA